MSIISFFSGEDVEAPIAVAAEATGSLAGSLGAVYIAQEIEIEVTAEGAINGEAVDTVVEGPIAISLTPTGSLSGYATRETAINIRASAQVSLSGSVIYDFAEPDPILPEIPAGWLDDQNYTARLIDSRGASIPFISADIRGDRNRLGEEANIVLAAKDWTGHTNDKTYTLQIGVRPSPMGTVTWHTLIDKGILQRVSFGSAYGSDAPDDTLSIQIGSTWQNKLSQFPTKPRVFYDPAATTVDVSSAEKIYYRNGSYEPTIFNAKAGLKLHGAITAVLNKTLGFTGLVTNIPNYPVTRVDYPMTSSYFDVIAGLTGLFDPLFYVENNVLHIINKNQSVPEDFDPESLTADEYVSWEMESGNPNLEGLVLIYTQKLGEALTTELRTIVTHEENGDFGEPGSTSVSTTQTFKDWKTVDGDIVRTELVREESTTTDHHTVVVGDSSEDHEFDGQGKRIRSTSVIRALMPQLTGGVDILQEVRREEKYFEYAADPLNVKAIYQRKIVNKTYGLIAIDSDNEYLGQPFRQSFDLAHEAGNLNDAMSVEFGLLETVTETVTPIAQNQFQYKQQAVDHLRQTTRNTISEPRSGNPTMGNTNGGRSRQMLILAEGVTPATRKGKGIQPFSVGELPLFYAIPLCKRVLANLIAGKRQARVVVSGWNSSMKRGLAFNAKDRAGSSYGLFITEGFNISLENMGTQNQRVSTALDVAEI